MAGSFWHSLRAVWVARWQEVAPRLQFWLLLGGYDVRDRSRADIFYVPYLIAFWSVWAFAMFTALSGAVAGLLKALDAATPALAAVQLYFWALLLWAIISLYQATRRSPFVFSAADAALLCQTPVDRRAVALLWFMSDWPRQFLPFAAGGLALGCTLCEDAWDADYALSPLSLIGRDRLDLAITISCSPYTRDKPLKRHRVFSAQADRLKTPLAAVNAVGLQNNGKTVYTFDGGSCVYFPGGMVAAIPGRFQPGALDVDLGPGCGAAGVPAALRPDGPAELCEALRYGIREFLKDIGLRRMEIHSAVSSLYDSRVQGLPKVLVREPH